MPDAFPEAGVVSVDDGAGASGPLLAVTVTVPVTCLPMPLAPTTRTVAVSPSTSSTLPVNTIVSPG